MQSMDIEFSSKSACSICCGFVVELCIVVQQIHNKPKEASSIFVRWVIQRVFNNFLSVLHVSYNIRPIVADRQPSCCLTVLQYSS